MGPHHIADALARYGCVAVFFLVGIESIGVPLPGEAALITGAVFAAQGRLPIVGVIASAALGGIVGGTGGYWIGRSAGAGLLERYGRFLRITPVRLQSMRQFFVRHGAPAVLISRFVALLRAWAFILAGTGKMPFGTFTLYNILGAVLWASAYGILGYVFGNNLHAIAHHISRAALGLAILGALGGSVYYLRHQKP